MLFPGFSYLYSIHDPMSDDEYRGEGDLSDGRMLIRWLGGHPAPGPAFWVGASRLFLHAATVEKLTARALTGWTTRPVVVLDQIDHEVPDYFEFEITGRCGPPDFSRSRVELSQFPGGWYPYLVGEYFVPDTWDGSDFFTEEMPPRIGWMSVRYAVQGAVSTLASAAHDHIDLMQLPEERSALDHVRRVRPELLTPEIEANVDRLYLLSGHPRPEGV